MEKERLYGMAQIKTVKRIITILDSIVSGKISTRINVSRRNEFYELSQAVNRLADHYQRAQNEIRILNKRLKDDNLGTIMALTEALNAKDPYTRGHSERVSFYALFLSEKLGLSNNEIDSIYVASCLHDIGKIGTNDGILNKPDRLTFDEYEHVKNHAQISSQIISQVSNLTHIADMVRHHHERFDGAGYPDGLSGSDIPLGARVLAIADAFDAMTSTRPYRPAFATAQALHEIQRCAGNQFDPELASTFIAAYYSTYGEHNATAAMIC